MKRAPIFSAGLVSRATALGGSAAPRLVRVVEGELVLFVCRDAVSASRHYLASVPVGGVLFDLGWSSLGPGLALVVEPLPGTQTEGVDAEALPAQALEAWVETLGAALGEERPRLPQEPLESLAAWHRSLASALDARLTAWDADQTLQYEARRGLGAQIEAEAWQELAGVMATGPSGFGPAPGGVQGALEAAFLRVAQALGVSGMTPPPPAETDDPLLRVGELARHTALRWRQVVLTPEWQRREHGPLIGWLQEEAGGEAVALLPEGPRSYRLVHASGKVERVRAAQAMRLAPGAVMLYRTLPTQGLGLGDLLRFALAGSGADLRLLVALVGVTGVLGVMTPALSARLYDVIIPGSEHGLLLQLVLILGVAAVTRCLFELARGVALIRVGNRAEGGLQAAVWDRLLKLPARFFREHTAGDLASRVQGVSDAWQLFSTRGVMVLFALPVGLFNLLVMFWYGPKLALWGVAIAFAGVAFSAALSVAEVLILRRRFAVRGRLAGLVVELINGVGKLRLANAESFAFSLWARQYAQQERLTMQAGRWSVLSRSFFTGFPLLVTGLLFALVAWLGGAGHGMSTGTFLAFYAAFGALIASLAMVAQQSLELLELYPLLERTRPIFEAIPEVSPARLPPGPLLGELEVNQVTFRYREDAPPVLERFSLRLRPGEMVALVGASGCGKSTLLRLLLGFETPETGTIFYDGKDLQTLHLQAVRRQIGVVLQQTPLFAGDLFRNIVGESNLSLDDAWAAAEMAGLADDIRAMPMQMHTVVSEGGSGFSGGQRQRLAIARAFAHRPRMLFFDEATSALDNRTQALVTASMEKMEITRIVIAHRLSTVRQAQRIIVMERGAIVEEGNFDALMAQRGVFYELARHQMR